MISLNKNKLLQLIKREEDLKLDFKATLSLATESEKKELAKDVIAIANSRGGRGYIIFGVEDKTKRILGVNPDEYSEEQIQQIIYNRCDPPVPLSVEFVDIDGKKVGVLTIYNSNNKPHQMTQNGAFYIRRGSTTDTARRSEVANMLQENGLLSFENVIIKNATLDSLDEDALMEYFKGFNVINGSPDKVLLEAMGIIGRMSEGDEYHPTIGGMLLFGKQTPLYLPYVNVKVLYEKGASIIRGNIPGMMKEVSELLREIINIPDYPYEALDEVVANAMIHRDYMDTSRGIVITISSHAIEVSNPGSLVASNSVRRYIKESNPIRRNPWLYQRILSMSNANRFMNYKNSFTGIKHIFRDIGEVKFLNIWPHNIFKVILPLKDISRDNK